ncbi:MAG: NfeD family protein [Christensenellales bacterium]|jgi:membrane-bound ClpP family serine protease
MVGLFETISTVSIVLFSVGMVLLLIELFIPGFGIFGGLGLLALILCIIFQAKTLTEALILVLIIGAIIALLAIIAGRSLRKGILYRSSLVLKAAAEKNEGYVSNDDYSRFIGKKGVSLTPLRPAGIAEIDGEKADVVTDGEYIQSGSKIEVSKVSGRRIIVKKAEA